MNMDRGNSSLQEEKNGFEISTIVRKENQLASANQRADTFIRDHTNPNNANRILSDSMYSPSVIHNEASPSYA